MLVHRRVTPMAGTHVYSLMEKGTVRIKCLAQEQKSIFPARARIQTARTQTARSEGERTNHEATAPLQFSPLHAVNCLEFELAFGNVGFGD